MVEVKHIEILTNIAHCSGTSKRSPECKKCGSWINHWEKYTKNSLNSLECCCLCGFGLKEVGAHVKINGYKGEWIIPACKSCNSKGGNDVIVYEVDAVSAIQCEE